MSKISKHAVFRNLYYIFIFSFICASFQCLGCDECFCECFDDVDLINYEQLEHYEEIFREFEIQAEIEEKDLDDSDGIMAKGFFLFKWGFNSFS